MYRKYFFKNKGVLYRKFVASGLAAVFGSGMFGSYAGAMESKQKNIEALFPMSKAPKLAEVLNKDSIKEDDKNTEKVFEFFINFSELPKLDLINFLWKDGDKTNNKLLNNEDFLIRVYAYLLLFKFYEFEGENKFSGINDFLEKLKFGSLIYHFMGVNILGDDDRTNLLNKIKNGWGKELLEKLKKEKLEKDEQNNLKIINTNLHNGSINKYELDKNKTKNKFRKTIIVVSVVIILLALIVAKTLAVKGKSNTGVPNNNNNKDDEKVNPSIDPVIPSTDPKSDDQNSQQNNQEERPSVVLSNILKATGATVTAGTGTLAYLFNKVSKSGKPSEVKNLRNVDGEFMYLDSAGNKVTKTEEGRKDNYDNDDKNANNSGKKQLLEDKDAEEKEEWQEEILENSTLSDDTEATSDGDKNKD